uniref:Hyaluronidase n=1 Tax=Elaeophora elaphi TaxID=1147741 RepID=A0A0R3RP10_9BILA
MIRSFSQLLMITWLTAINAIHQDKFDVIWNVPSEQCKEWMLEERPESYGVLVNKGHKFHGEKIVLLYEEKFGLYPYYKNESDPESAINGGIPQVSDHSIMIFNLALIVRELPIE